MKQLLKRESEAQKGEGGESTAADAGNGGGSSGSSAPWFADALLDQAGEELSAWACKNRGGFVVAALEEVPSSSAGVRKVLGAKGARARLVKDAKDGSSMGAKVGGVFRWWGGRRGHETSTSTALRKKEPTVGNADFVKAAGSLL